jgi:4'-phosphopantetheinyl transferase
MPFDLALDEVHCWSVPLDASPTTLAVLFETLTDDERARAARLRFERDRRRFIVARATLRELLGRYVGTPPDQVHFAYTAFGKPKLTPEFDGPHCVKFNLSHSADLALIAVAWDAEVGVDVEHIRPSDYGDIARSSFAPSEIAQLRAAPRHLQARAFFNSWTRREAYAKARGESLPDGPVEPRGQWTFFSLEPAAGYIGAVAVERNGRGPSYATPYPQRWYGRYSLSRFALITSSVDVTAAVTAIPRPTESLAGLRAQRRA